MLLNMIGQVFKIHSDFYYVVEKEGETFSKNALKAPVECKLREILKKKKTKIFVGDFVEFESGGAIVKVLERKNFCPRPCVSNLDLMVVVSAVCEPALDFVQLNRYLTFLKYYNIEALLCFNKDDLLNEEELNEVRGKIDEIYTPLGYKYVFTSALSKDGLLDLKKFLKGKTVAFTGLSGVGKSSVLNALNPSFNLRTKSVTGKLKRGTHTTRHCEIMNFGDFKITDTPGFSKLTFDFLLPAQLGELFDEIKKYKDGCKYRNCLHIEESKGCNVLENIENINITRYKSYVEFLNEAKKYKEKVTFEGTKEEKSVKTSNKKEIAKISTKKRADSRKKTKQNTKNILLEHLQGFNDD